MKALRNSELKSIFIENGPEKRLQQRPGDLFPYMVIALDGQKIKVMGSGKKTDLKFSNFSLVLDLTQPNDTNPEEVYKKITAKLNERKA